MAAVGHSYLCMVTRAAYACSGVVQEGMEQIELAHFQHIGLATYSGYASDYIPSQRCTQCRLVDTTEPHSGQHSRGSTKKAAQHLRMGPHRKDGIET